MTKLPIDINWDGKGWDIFCTKCLTHERHFKGGGSWSPDLCPCGCEDTIVWNEMNWIQRIRAQALYNRNEESKHVK
jgi:hypothetical protein